jgi:hypothetical protein
MHKDQVAGSFGDSFDKEWLYVDAPAARGWCSRRFLQDAPEVALPSPAWPKRPHGKAEIIRIFGSPGSAQCRAGRVTLPAPLPLSWRRTETVTVVACHKLLEDVFASAFRSIHDHGLWDELENFGGIYNDRTVTASQKISTHAWGISGDFDTLDNALGAVPKMHPKIILIFEDHGFFWGGRWNRPDGMHYQYATGY